MAGPPRQLHDLEPGLDLYVRCRSCGRWARFTDTADMTIADLARRLRCRRCGGRDPQTQATWSSLRHLMDMRCEGEPDGQ